MTKEELKKEAYKEAEKLKEYQTEPNNEYEKGFNNGEVRGYKDGYRDGAELREKQIQIDAKQIRALQKQNGELTDKVKELEQQIEKMKCCYNCKHSRIEYEHCRTDKHEKWEMKND